MCDWKIIKLKRSNSLKTLSSILPEPLKTASACFPTGWRGPARSNSSPETNWAGNRIKTSNIHVKGTAPMVVLQVLFSFCSHLSSTSPNGCRQQPLSAPRCWDASASAAAWSLSGCWWGFLKEENFTHEQQKQLQKHPSSRIRRRKSYIFLIMVEIICLNITSSLMWNYLLKITLKR